MKSRKQIDALVEGIFSDINFQSEPAGLYDPLRYMMGIGGKRIRPTLCLLVYNLFRDEMAEGVADCATALEVFHTFTLIHDDIMDRSPLRRGRDTVWKKWSEDTAILSGDVMLIDAYKRIMKAPVEQLGAACELFSTTASQVCDGQQYDFEFEHTERVSIEDYAKMIGLKTAVLIACSAKMGALLAGASQSDCDALYRYGYELGMAFQVADDYLDAFGDEKVFGKPIGGDIINGKKSWLTVMLLDRADATEGFSSAQVLEAMALPSATADQRAAKIETVKSLYTALGVGEAAKQEILRYSRRAMDAIAESSLGQVEVEELRGFAESLIGRAK